MTSHSFFAAAKGINRVGQFMVVALLPAFLVACHGTAPPVADKLGMLVAPESKVVDYQQVPCDRLWQAVDDKIDENPLYWLRAMDCAVRFSPAEARAEARRWPQDDWHSAFKQGVLLANGNVTPQERRAYLQRLDTFSQYYPAPVRPLMQLWWGEQMGQLQLSEERMRYSHLQQASDAQLDALRQQQLSLGKELTLTRRKLERLTDIERQLSSRRSPDGADNGHSEKSDGADSALPPGTTKDTRQP
ncbi:two-component system QseEF-associated lipoprotein QseG [Erwinia psidii]|uniref:two-component system QseEF-associated lipoprotein QseG n=1 Tax=Erwinia psidii TaxID=69224 RepID=UPI00226B69F1|nr:two-component system QseEF-associated lipoprotein QseG [Erwinia psidii]MCX8956803.1 two-component system QseEF-associated lipoprotein QseG [Erwinia psidii]